MLRPQRLAAPVRVLIEQFSAHPLERDAEHLYGPPDGFVDTKYAFHRERTSASDVPVYEAELRPEDGLYLLPYMALRSDGSAWEDDSAGAVGDETSRQPFFPDASRLFAEIDRFGVGPDGWGSQLAKSADFDFYRAAPSGGYRNGLAAHLRTDIGSADIAPEARGKDFFPYRPAALRTEPTRLALGALTNTVQNVAWDRRYAGLIWLEGSPDLEETLYWLSLVIDTAMPIVGCVAQRAHGSVGAEGDRNIVGRREVHHLRGVAQPCWRSLHRAGGPPRSVDLQRPRVPQSQLAAGRFPEWWRDRGRLGLDRPSVDSAFGV